MPIKTSHSVHIDKVSLTKMEGIFDSPRGSEEPITKIEVARIHRQYNKSVGPRDPVFN
jgi:hypothetical protein